MAICSLLKTRVSFSLGDGSRSFESMHRLFPATEKAALRALGSGSRSARVFLSGYCCIVRWAMLPSLQRFRSIPAEKNMGVWRGSRRCILFELCIAKSAFIIFKNNNVYATSYFVYFILYLHFQYCTKRNIFLILLIVTFKLKHITHCTYTVQLNTFLQKKEKYDFHTAKRNNGLPRTPEIRSLLHSL